MVNYKEELIKQILINPEINRFESGEQVLILNGIKFIVAEEENIKSNHKPKGLYIEANSIIEYIKRNLFGHDKKKYGINK